MDGKNYPGRKGAHAQVPYLTFWSENANQGLERAYLFLAEKNEDAASGDEKVLLLEQFPNAGRPANDLDPEHRELLVPFGSLWL